MNTVQMDIGKITTPTNVNLVITLVEPVTSKEVQEIVILVPPHTSYMKVCVDTHVQMVTTVMKKNTPVNNVDHNVLLVLT